MPNTDPWRLIIRVVKDAAGGPWFVAGDVCDALELVSVARSMPRLDEDEKGIQTVKSPIAASILYQHGRSVGEALVKCGGKTGTKQRRSARDL